MRFARKWRRQRSGGRVGGPGSSVSDAGSPIGSERLETRLRLTRFARRRLKSRRFVVGILQRSAGAPAFWRKPLLFFLLRRAHLFSLRAPAECVGGAVSRASRLVFGIPRGGFLVADECGERRGRRSGPGPELIYGNGPLSDSLCSLGGLRPAWQSAPASRGDSPTSRAAGGRQPRAPSRARSGAASGLLRTFASEWDPLRTAAYDR